MVTIEELRDWGADVDSGLARCMGKESFYLRLVGMAVDTDKFDRCGKALADGDLDAAFEAAHGLKGALGNLDLTPVYEPVSRLTEALRGRTGEDYLAMYKEVETGWNELCRMLES